MFRLAWCSQGPSQYLIFSESIVCRASLSNQRRHACSMGPCLHAQKLRDTLQVWGVALPVSTRRPATGLPRTAGAFQRASHGLQRPGSPTSPLVGTELIIAGALLTWLLLLPPLCLILGSHPLASLSHLLLIFSNTLALEMFLIKFVHSFKSYFAVS